MRGADEAALHLFDSPKRSARASPPEMDEVSYRHSDVLRPWGGADEQEEPRNSKDAVTETFLAHWMI